MTGIDAVTALGWIAAALAGASGALAMVNAVAWPRLRPARAASGLPESRLPDLAATPGKASEATGPRPLVSVLVPARDEEETLPGCLDAVLGQAGLEPGDRDGEDRPSGLEVLVYDDGSEDATARVVEERAALDPRLRLLPGGDLPAGWCGKPHALARLAEAARGRWLFFLDADARPAPGALAALVGEAERRELDLLAAWPGLVLEGAAERLLMPMLDFVVLTLYPSPLQTLRRDPGLGLAHGASILVRARAYRAMGGHGAVRSEIFEDTALARAFRRAGLDTLCVDGQDLVRVRMYGSFGEIWNGFRKNFYPAFASGWSFALFLAFHALAFLLPFGVLPVLAGAVLAGAVDASVLLPWGIAAAATLGARGALALRFGRSLAPVLAHPVAEAVLVALGLASWRAVASGAGVEWKGRRYRAGEGSGEGVDEAADGEANGVIEETTG